MSHKKFSTRLRGICDKFDTTLQSGKEVLFSSFTEDMAQLHTELTHPFKEVVNTKLADLSKENDFITSARMQEVFNEGFKKSNVAANFRMDRKFTKA